MLQIKRADEAMETVVKQMGKTKSNDEFLDVIGKYAK
jgi:transcription termination factor Rho